MDGETVLNELEANTASFIATMCYRNMADMQIDALNHDGNVVMASEAKMNGKSAIWRALHEAATEQDTNVLIVTPNQGAARGVILLIEDELERTPFSKEVWGITNSTDTKINFDNGSKILSHQVSDEDDGDYIRGYKPDLLIVDNWEEEGHEISDEVKESVLIPMIAVGETNLWVNDVSVDSSDPIIDTALNMGAYVKQLDR